MLRIEMKQQAIPKTSQRTWARRLAKALSERDEAISQRDDLLRELKRVVQFFGADEDKGLLPAGFATFNGARAAIAKAEGIK